MALLSNVNGKFSIDSTGAVQFSGAAGASGYVLKSNGAGSAPTWVDGSTVIGGPYLPLSGGTLTGATATASGISFTVGGTLDVTSTSNFTGQINVGSVVPRIDSTFSLGSNSLRFASIYGDGLTITNNATFGGSIIVNSTGFTKGGHKISNYFATDAADGEILNLGVTGNIGYIQSLNGTTPNTLTFDGSSVSFRTGSFSTALTLDSSQNATFAGILTVQGAGAASYGSLSLVSSDSFIRLNTTGGTTDKQKWDIRTVSASGYEALDFRTVNDANNSFSTKLSIAHGGNATFAGDVIIPEYIKHSGDTDTYIRVLPDEWIFRTGGSDRLTISNSNTYFTNTNVGIGYTSPASILHVGSTGTNAYSTTITKGSNMKGIINTLSNNADDMVGIYFATGTTTEGTHWSGITGSRTDNASHWGTQLNFYTHANDLAALNDATQKMVIKGDGKVGIGTTSPSQLLHVNSSTNNPTGIGLQNSERYYSVRSNNFSLVFTDETVGSERMRITSAGDINILNATATDSKSIGITNAAGTTGWTFGNGVLSNTHQFVIYDNTAGSPRMLIDSSGKVGIGTTSPTNQMHIHTDNDNTYALRVEGSTNNGAGVWTGIGIAGESTNTKSAIIFEDIGVSYARGKLLFCVNNEQNQNSASPSDAKMTISNDGKLGIGTTSPDFELDVAGSIGIDDYIYHNGDHNTYIRAQGDQWTFRTGGDDRMHIDNTGVGIGTTSPNEKLSVLGNANFGSTLFNYAGPAQYGAFTFPRGQILFSNTNTQNQLYLVTNAYNNSSGVFAYRNSSQTAISLAMDNGAFSFLTAASGNADAVISWNTSMIIQNNGNVGIRDTSPTSTLHIGPGGTNQVGIKVQGNSSSTVENILSYNSQAHGTGWYHLVGQYYSGGYANAIIIYGNGNVQNLNNSYGQVSDERLKENITDATPKLEDIKKLKVKNFNFKGDDLKQIGMIAQEVEEVFPGLVEEVTDPKTKEKSKSLKYSVFVPMLIKSIQELEARVKELENK
jgi:hypothetical protein